MTEQPADESGGSCRTVAQRHGLQHPAGKLVTCLKTRQQPGYRLVHDEHFRLLEDLHHQV